eukprot:TRINITY_DN7735_c0_g1_i1.p1 TRINITY_DN7735_c0_g1~~TRINITY_DN7735_c0_g1_i1.p1  ORF type:complete len:485 (-),score=200.28 TRINITY_DN7735_c0_g1_i1:104-1558(-)
MGKKVIDKRVLIFTNNDDPFGSVKESRLRADLMRTTIQKAKDLQDLGIELELFPMSRVGEEFNVRLLYAELLDRVQADDMLKKPCHVIAAQKFDDMVNQMKKKTLKKRMVARVILSAGEQLQIGLRAYAIVRPAKIAKAAYVNAKDNTPLSVESFLICLDTGAVLTGQLKRQLQFGEQQVIFSADELKEVKSVMGPPTAGGYSGVDLRLHGFKPMEQLLDYHNLQPSTFLYPTDDAISGSTQAAIALHAAMVKKHQFAVAVWGKSTPPRLVALLAQEEKEDVETGQQQQPPGFAMIFLPFLEDIRPAEMYDRRPASVQATPEQVLAMSAMLKKMELRNFSVLDIQNPVLQRHYSMLQAIALEEDTLPDMADTTLPDYTAMQRPNIKVAVKAAKDAVYGTDYDEEMSEAAAAAVEKQNAVAEKRKAMADAAKEQAARHDWKQLAEEGKLAMLTNEGLKSFLRSIGRPISGTKKELIDRILQHLGM